MRTNVKTEVAMRQQGSPLFDTYTRTLRRLYWADFLETQVRAAKLEQYRASIVQPSIPEDGSLAAAFDYHRRRTHFGD